VLATVKIGKRNVADRSLNDQIRSPNDQIVGAANRQQ
jgi:hypothetical protein